jgi:DMSO/TMAO reductase YedYZ molybdopterin-dependent catalytic subunit
MWYAEQRWQGIRLDRLIDVGDARSVRVGSSTGYSRRYPARDLPNLWLVLRVNGEPLSAGHGYPARIAAPGRRGFWWVKWVTDIEPSDLPAWLQLPYPIT